MDGIDIANGYFTVPTVWVLNNARMLAIAVIWRMNIRSTLICAGAKSGFQVFTTRQIQFILPSTRYVYERFIRNVWGTYRDRAIRDIEPIESDNDSAILWLGDRRRAKKVVFFIHGGGFFVPMSRAHIKWCWNVFVLQGAKSGTETACAILQYSLSPGTKYPVHLRQAARGLQMILDQGFDLDDIAVGGDSAGGNITMQLLMHLHRPCPGVQPLKLEKPLSAAFLVSPFLTHRNDSFQSFNDNKHCDMAPGRRGMEDLIRLATGKLDIDEGKYLWLTPVDAESEWFRGFEQVVRQMYITVGSYEIMADHGRAMGRILKEGAPDLDLVVEVGPREAHDAVVTEYLTFQSGGPGTKRMQKWFASYLKGF